MKEPSMKIILKQIKRLGLKNGDDIPCLVKYAKKRDLARLQQGYIKLPGPYAFVHRSEWEFRGRDENRDMVWAVKRKPGKKDVGERKRRKTRHRLDRYRKRHWSEKRERQAKIDRDNAAWALFKEIARLRKDFGA